MLITKVIAFWLLLFPVIGAAIWIAEGMKGRFLSVLKGGLRTYLGITFLFITIPSLMFVFFYWR